MYLEAHVPIPNGWVLNFPSDPSSASNDPPPVVAPPPPPPLVAAWECIFI